MHPRVARGDGRCLGGWARALEVVEELAARYESDGERAHSEALGASEW